MIVKEELEAQPESYPEFVGTLAAVANSDEICHVWQRIESYISWRFSERQVTWIIQGAGAWTPRLKPFVIQNVETWKDGEWVAHSPAASPFGGFEFSEGVYRITANVGAEIDVPPLVMKAVERLANYFVNALEPMTRPNGASRVSIDFEEGRGLKFEEDQIKSMSYSRDENWMAKAMISSGAADLLRRYRGNINV